MFSQLISEKDNSIISELVLSDRNVTLVNKIFKKQMTERNIKVANQDVVSIILGLKDAIQEVAIHEKRLNLGRDPGIIKQIISGKWIHHRLDSINIDTETPHSNQRNISSMVKKINDRAIERMVNHAVAEYGLRSRYHREKNRPFTKLAYLTGRRPIVSMHRRTPKKMNTSRGFFHLQQFDTPTTQQVIGVPYNAYI